MVKVFLAAAGPIALMLATCAGLIGTSLAVAPKIPGAYIQPQVSLFHYSKDPTAGDFEVSPDKETEEPSFLQERKLDKLKDRYNRLKREYKEVHGAEAFYRLKYTTMNKVLKKGIKKQKERKLEH